MAARGGKVNQVYPMSSEESSRDKANFNGQKGNDDTGPVPRYGEIKPWNGEQFGMHEPLKVTRRYGRVHRALSLTGLREEIMVGISGGARTAGAVRSGLR
jgi:hypothetical protein